MSDFLLIVLFASSVLFILATALFALVYALVRVAEHLLSIVLAKITKRARHPRHAASN